ncbi:hypothetical protein QRX50_29465 [Amycolatopsis carbonis]|uniref:Uncharacterized protein n=1 Tax=Amycolatopsis carbonis TaxID=715471 RepID=A0A9Y2I899_9PSEU|nr:hypothetical protein [Amycolatopsis sp. 2-15]WIX75620.1 hypothetical protein QRX50_29465 [Amycolatopsis sp. 2-15]
MPRGREGKARIEGDARRDVAERGRRSTAIRRYLQAAERRASDENEKDVVPESAPEPGA